MTSLHEWIVAQNAKSCVISYMALFVAVIALALGLVHLAGCGR